MDRKGEALRAPIRRTAWAALMCASLGMAAPLQAATATVLDDFEGTIDEITGVLSPSGPVSVDQRPGMRAGMRIAPAGQGACSNLTGASRALCGADTLQFAGFDGARLSYDVTYGPIGAVLFDLAAWSNSDPFDPYYGDRPDEWGDYIRVQAFAGGAWTLLAEFTGTREPGLQQGLVSTGAGLLLDTGVVLDANFRTIALIGMQTHFFGPGQLLFEFRSTGSAEQFGIDNIRLLPVPLPGAVSLLLLGLGALGALRLGRRA